MLQRNIAHQPPTTVDGPKREKRRDRNSSRRIPDHPKSFDNDPWIFRIVVVFLGLVVVIVTISCSVAAYQGIKVPEVLNSLGSAALGALAGIVARPFAS